MRSPMKWFLTGLFVTGLFVVGLQCLSRVRLEREVEGFARRNREFARLTNENRRLAAAQPTADEVAAWRANHAELLRLRADAAKLSTAASTPPLPTHFPVTDTGSVFRPKTVSTADLKVRSEWTNAGTTTPTATFETSCWAEATGDIDGILSTLAINPAARTKAKEVFDRLSPADQAKYGTPDRLLAMLMVGDHTEFAGILVLDEIERSPGNVVLHTLWQYDDGRIRENTNVKLQQTADGWRIPVTAKDADELIKWRLQGESPVPPEKPTANKG